MSAARKLFVFLGAMTALEIVLIVVGVIVYGGTR